MTTDLATRRSIRKVSRADFAAFAVWEWALGEDVGIGHDESFVRPTAHAAVPLTDGQQFIVLGNAILSDASSLPACFDVVTRAGKQQIEPMFIMLLDRHLDFSGLVTTTVLSRFTKRMNTYPVRWELSAPLDGESALRRGNVRRSLLVRFRQTWLRLRLAAGGASVLTP